MTHDQETDERRARAVCALSSKATRAESGQTCLAIARAIRLSDESAGYITAKLEGTVNEKDGKG